jgi:hypothetical protein
MANKRQILVIAERGRLIGFCLACRCRTPENKIADLVCGIVDGSALTEVQFRERKEEADVGWRMRYPEAEIIYMACPESVNPQDFARLEAERRVSI